MRLLVDEMWPATLARKLRDRGHDANAVLERPDLVHGPDYSVFSVAQDEQRAIFTENVRDYLPLARECFDRGEDFVGLPAPPR